MIELYIKQLMMNELYNNRLKYNLIMIELYIKQ